MSGPHERLFFALWPDDAVRAKLAAAIPTVSEAGRAIPTDNLHATLAFLGDVASTRISELIDVATTLSFEAFDLHLERLEVWNRALVCLVPTAVPEPLVALERDLRCSLAEHQFPIDARQYRPHVTLIRERQRGLGRRHPLMSGRRDGEQLDLPVSWHVDGFALVRSRVGPSGSRYEAVAHW